MSEGRVVTGTIGLREYFERLLIEQEKQNSERFAAADKAVSAALAAQEKATAAAFAASKEAILKAEEAQRAYNTSHNDLARKMDEQNKGTMPRTETEARFRGLEEKISDLRTALGIGGATAIGASKVKDESRANIAVVVSILGLLVTVAVLLLRG